MKKLIIFDFDGTLVDTAPDIALYANEVLGEFGFSACSLEVVKKAVGRGVHELFKDLAPALKEDPESLEKAATSFKKRYGAFPVVHTKLYPGVEEMLAWPLSQFKKAIVTNKPHLLTAKILEDLGLGPYFDKVIGLEAGYPPKPDPASVLFVMESLGVLPEETLYIGDSQIDAETCKNAAIDFAWVDYGYDDLNGQIPPIRFSSPFEWKSLLRFS